MGWISSFHAIDDLPCAFWDEARVSSLEILNLASIGIILSRQWTTKALIRLRGCAGWSAPLLFAYCINRFSHDIAHSYHAGSKKDQFSYLIHMFIILYGHKHIVGTALKEPHIRRFGLLKYCALTVVFLFLSVTYGCGTPWASSLYSQCGIGQYQVSVLSIKTK